MFIRILTGTKIQWRWGNSESKKSGEKRFSLYRGQDQHFLSHNGVIRGTQSSLDITKIQGFRAKPEHKTFNFTPGILTGLLKRWRRRLEKRCWLVFHWWRTPDWFGAGGPSPRMVPGFRATMDATTYRQGNHIKRWVLDTTTSWKRSYIVGSDKREFLMW